MQINKIRIFQRKYRKDLNVLPIYKTVDTCSAEFSSSTPYHYSTYEETFINLNSRVFDNEISEENNNIKKIMIIGGGPNRIGQGIEFDYCCCRFLSSYNNGYKTIMVNSNLRPSQLITIQAIYYILNL